MTGLEDLEASQRAISNLLYQHAHDSGRITEPGAVFEIPMATVRTGISKHESGDRLRASLTALARIVAKATYTEEGAGGKGRQQRVVIGGLFKFFNVAQQDLAAGATLRFALNDDLVAVIDRSARWGRIKAEVFCAMRSRYAIALYEALALRRNMDRCIETFPIDRFRELLAVKAFAIDRPGVSVSALPNDIGVVPGARFNRPWKLRNRFSGMLVTACDPISVLTSALSVWSSCTWEATVIVSLKVPISMPMSIREISPMLIGTFDRRTSRNPDKEILTS
jgi:hypothetical protein